MVFKIIFLSFLIFFISACFGGDKNIKIIENIDIKNDKNKPEKKGKISVIKNPSTEDEKHVTQATKDLLAKQRENFPKILSELKANKKKTSHWIWWVFPTEKSGLSEDTPKTKVTLDQVDYILKYADLNAWSTILEEIYQLLKSQSVGPWKNRDNRPNPAVIPPIDHDRINYALKFWLETAGDKIQKNRRFYEAFKNLDRFYWKS